MRLRANAHGGGGVDVGLRSHAQLWRARASGGDRGDSRAIISRDSAVGAATVVQ